MLLQSNFKLYLLSRLVFQVQLLLSIKKKRSTTAFNFLVIYLPLFSFTDQEGIAEAICFGTARKIIELLGSATLKEIGSIWGTGVEDDIEKLKKTVSTNTLYFTTSESYILPISHNKLKK